MFLLCYLDILKEVKIDIRIHLFRTNRLKIYDVNSKFYLFVKDLI